MLRVLVEPVEIGIGRPLLDDENSLAKTQHLIEPIRRQSLEALPFRLDCWHAGPVGLNAEEEALRWNRGITARFLILPSTTAPNWSGPAGPGSRFGSFPISSSSR